MKCSETDTESRQKKRARPPQPKGQTRHKLLAKQSPAPHGKVSCVRCECTKRHKLLTRVWTDCTPASAEVSQAVSADQQTNPTLFTSTREVVHAASEINSRSVQEARLGNHVPIGEKSAVRLPWNTAVFKTSLLRWLQFYIFHLAEADRSADHSKRSKTLNVLNTNAIQSRKKENPPSSLFVDGVRIARTVVLFGGSKLLACPWGPYGIMVACAKTSAAENALVRVKRMIEEQHHVALTQTKTFALPHEPEDYPAVLRSLIEFTLISRLLESGKWIHVGENMETLVDARVLTGPQLFMTAKPFTSCGPLLSAEIPLSPKLLCSIHPPSAGSDASKTTVSPDFPQPSHKPPPFSSRMHSSFSATSASRSGVSSSTRSNTSSFSCRHVNVPGFVLRVCRVFISLESSEGNSEQCCLFSVQIKPLVARVLPLVSFAEDLPVQGASSPIFCLPRLVQAAIFKGFAEKSALFSTFRKAQDFKNYWSSKRPETLDHVVSDVLRNSVATVQLIEHMPLTLSTVVVCPQSCMEGTFVKSFRPQFRSATDLLLCKASVCTSATADTPDEELVKRKNDSLPAAIQTCVKDKEYAIGSKIKLMDMVHLTQGNLSQHVESLGRKLPACNGKAQGKESEVFGMLNSRLPIRRAKQLKLPTPDVKIEGPLAQLQKSIDENITDSGDDYNPHDSLRRLKDDARSGQRETKECKPPRILPPVQCYSHESRRTRTQAVAAQISFP